MCVRNGPGGVAVPGPRGVRVRLGRLSGELTELPRVWGPYEEERKDVGGQGRLAVRGGRLRRVDDAAAGREGPAAAAGARLAVVPSPQGGDGARAGRRGNGLLWGILPPVPRDGVVHHAVHVDGIHLGRDAVVLMAVADGHVIGWHVAASERASSWACLLRRIAPPDVVVCDGGGAIASAVASQWPGTRVRRCLFAFADPAVASAGPVPATNNVIESWNARIRAMLRAHRGMSPDRRIKAVCRWCHQHTECPESDRWLVDNAPTVEQVERMRAAAGDGAGDDGYGTGTEWKELHRAA